MAEPPVVPEVLPARQAPVLLALEAQYAAPGLDAKLAKFREVYQPLRLYEELALARGLLERFLTTYEAQNVLLGQLAEYGEGNLPRTLLGPAEAIQHVRLVADLVKIIHSLEGAEVVAKQARRMLVTQIGRAVEEEIAATADENDAGWQQRLLRRIRDRWLKIVT